MEGEAFTDTAGSETWLQGSAAPLTADRRIRGSETGRMIMRQQPLPCASNLLQQGAASKGEGCPALAKVWPRPRSQARHNTTVADRPRNRLCHKASVLPPGGWTYQH